MLNIVADENLADLASYFAAYGQIRAMAGRAITRDDLVSADVLLVRSVTQVNEDLLSGTGVKFVGTATIGTDHLDIGYLQRAGIQWASAPGCNANAVADYVCSSISQIDGLWERLFAGAKVGIVGCGNVGQQVFQRFSALNISCRIYDPFLSIESLPLASFEEVLACELLCLHTPLTQTGPYPSYQMLNDNALKYLRSDVVLINAGRGDVISEAAIIRFMQQQPDAKVILDVWPKEPDISTTLLQQVYLATPHIAGYSQQGKQAGTAMIYRAFCRHFNVAVDEGCDDVQPIVLHLPAGLSDGDTLRWALLSVYRSASDDRLMRETILHAKSVVDAFDYLRKTYPLRNECCRYRLSYDQPLSNFLHASLQSMGFIV